MLQARSPLRVAVFPRTNSPLYLLEKDELVARACTTLGVDPTESCAKLLTVWKVYRDHLLLRPRNEGYNWATSYHEVDLTVILVDYGKRLPYVRA